VNRRILLIGHNGDYLPLAPYNLGLHLSERGYSVSLLLPGNKLAARYWTKQINDRFTLYFCPTLLWGAFRKGLDPLDLIMKVYLTHKLDFDVVFVFDTRPAVILPGVYAKLVKKIPLIIYWTDWFGRGGIISDRSGKLYRFFFERIETFFEEDFRGFADSYAVICPALETRLKALGYEKKIIFLPTGCNSTPIKDYNPVALRERLDLPRDATLIGCVGSLHPFDAKLAFESVALLSKKTNARLVLIGNNIYRNRYRIPDSAIETGKVSKEDLYNYIGACDVMLIPLKRSIANNGRWPSKLNDYVILGKPVVATDISVVSKLFRLAKFGEVANDEPGDFAEKLESLLKNNDRLKEYSNNAYALASGLLSWSSIVDTVDDLVTTTLSSA
jgi:glycosyltransferase involved in cell wall biosynthesis